MIILKMQFKFFPYNRSTNEQLDKESINLQIDSKKKISVDINKLLNRVKQTQQNETKEKLIFLSFGIIVITLMGIIISVIK